MRRDRVLMTPSGGTRRPRIVNDPTPPTKTLSMWSTASSASCHWRRSNVQPATRLNKMEVLRRSHPTTRYPSRCAASCCRSWWLPHARGRSQPSKVQSTKTTCSKDIHSTASRRFAFPAPAAWVAVEAAVVEQPAARPGAAAHALTTRGVPLSHSGTGRSPSGTSSSSDRLAAAQPRVIPAASTTTVYSSRWSLSECTISAVHAAAARTA